MTPEKAIKRLESIIDEITEHGSFYFISDDIEIFKLAIKALSTQTEEEKRTRERILRLEETIDLVSRGAQMTLKKFYGAGLEDWEFDDLTKKIKEIHEELYGATEDDEE